LHFHILLLINLIWVDFGVMARFSAVFDTWIRRILLLFFCGFLVFSLKQLQITKQTCIFRILLIINLIWINFKINNAFCAVFDTEFGVFLFFCGFSVFSLKKLKITKQTYNFHILSIINLIWIYFKNHNAFFRGI
jgi:hypothetical protein